MRRFEGKVVLVTGASKGIGAACARRFALEGAVVVVNFNQDHESAGAIVASIEALGGQAIAVRGSVAVPEDVDRILQVVDASFGRLDVLINNAGVFQPGLLETVDLENFRWHFETNVLGMLLMCQMATKLFPKVGGSIVNVGSTASTTAPAGGTVYAASKGAVTTVVKSLAKELAPQLIRVNGVNPGYVKTEGVLAAGLAGGAFEEAIVAGTPLGRAGRPEEIASAVAFLASDEASFVTGEVLVVSGGAGM